MQPGKRVEHKPDPNKFDLRTHIWDSQGNLVQKNLYTNHVIEGRSYFERPIHSGNLWYENNQPAGRVEYKDGKKNILEGAAHVAYTMPPEGPEAFHIELEKEREKSASLEARLAALEATQIKTERDAKADDIATELKPEAPSLKPKGKA